MWKGPKLRNSLRRAYPVTQVPSPAAAAAPPRRMFTDEICQVGRVINEGNTLNLYKKNGILGGKTDSQVGTGWEAIAPFAVQVGNP